jgi:mono/diheme cytochrome c family protein
VQRLRPLLVSAALFGLLLAAAVLPPEARGAPAGKMPSTRPSDRERGRELWLRSCWQCHGEAGKGDGPAAAAFAAGVPSLVGKVPPEEFDRLVTVVLDGRGPMPAFREDIDKHDTRRILVYLQDALQGRTKSGDDKKDEEEADEKEAEGAAN